MFESKAHYYPPPGYSVPVTVPAHANYALTYQNNGANTISISISKPITLNHADNPTVSSTITLTGNVMPGAIAFTTADLSDSWFGLGPHQYDTSAMVGSFFGPGFAFDSVDWSVTLIQF